MKLNSYKPHHYFLPTSMRHPIVMCACPIIKFKRQSKIKNITRPVYLNGLFREAGNL